MSELKDALERRSERFDLEPGAMDRFFRRRERRDRRRRVAAICLALGVTAAGALLAVRALSSDEPVPAAPPKTDQELLAELAGTYTVTLDDSTPAVRENDMAGEYTMTLGANGVLDLTAPAGFVEGRDPSGITFRISGDMLTTNAFVNVACSNTVGRYRWTLSGTELSFEPLVDPCAVRRTLFASNVWERQP
jgi:hypothetical protein